MEIKPATKISALLKANPAALEAITSINPHFEKLRNPLLRKLLASRVSIADAARIGGCPIETFFEKLAPLGFTAAQNTNKAEAIDSSPLAILPLFLENLPENAFTYLDVRDKINTGQDPLLEILSAVNSLSENQALVVLNTFEPTPLFQILQKRGFHSFAQQKEENLVYAYFWRMSDPGVTLEEKIISDAAPDFDLVLEKFKDQLQHLDVCHLEMPQPMVSILEALAQLPEGFALQIAHRRVPQYLLPQLQERNFAIAINETGPDQVQLLIYKEAY